MADHYTVYSANSHRGQTAVGAIRALWRDIATHRWQIGQLFYQDFVGTSRLTRLGGLWNYILPLVPITVWVLLSGLRFFPSFNGVSSVVYVTLGVTFWFFLAGFVSLPVSTIESKIRGAARSQVPLIGVIISSFATLVFDTLVRLAGCVLVFLLFQGPPNWHIIFTPFVLLFAALFFSGCGLTLAIFNLAYRDIGKIVPIILQYGLLLSSVLFPLTSIPVMAKISLFNPFYIFIETLRSLIIFGTVPHPVSLAVFSLAGVVLFVFGCRVFHVSEQRLKGFV